MSAFRPRGRHHRRSRTSATTLVTGLTAAVLAAEVAGAAGAGAAGSSDFSRLRLCESGGNYTIDTGNGYYGAYQFDLQTWWAMGYSGLPSDALPATQDEAAARLQAARGWEPWPACSRSLGLSGQPHAYSSPATRTVRVSTSAGSAFGGTALSVALAGSARSDVRAWQAQMARRGWPIAVDGVYGPQSAAFCTAFERDKGLAVDQGIVGPQVWWATWHAPVT